MLESIQSSKDYQLQSLISQFTRFRKECVTNTSEEILRMAVHLAKEECDIRGIPYE